MELIKLFNLQGSLFIMILAGAVLKRKGIIDEPGKRCLTDLCVNIIIPVSYTHLDVYKRQYRGSGDVLYDLSSQSGTPDLEEERA